MREHIPKSSLGRPGRPHPQPLQGGSEILKKIEAIIREDKVNDVREALKQVGILGMNVFEIRGRGYQGRIALSGRSGSYVVDMLPKM